MAGFHDIIGHEKIKEHLQKAIGYQRVSHAYILSGEEGMGRKTIAKAFAMTLLCEKHGTEPCMECHSCKQFLSGNHPDVKEAPQCLQDKHYLRKHGPGAYYGQGNL